ncbi:MAG TPA: HAD-IIIC family phosphatase [Bryobacteraceae bacterium]|nr:HAD-IIIC family phosphatase [Bryobacteraceae bacterium]
MPDTAEYNESASVSSDQQTSFQFAVAATFTADPVKRTIQFWSRPLHASLEVSITPFGQIHQTLLDPQSAFALNRRGANAVLVRLEDLGSVEAQIQENLRLLIADIGLAAARISVPLIFCICPPSPAAASRLGSFCGSAARLAETALAEVPGVQFLTHQEIAKQYPVEVVHDPQGESLGAIPYTEAWFCALGTCLVRRVHALLRPPFKLIALDCDNTLWQGICGEDGPEGVTLDPPRRLLHEFMLDQREAGCLLAMASKNNEDDVMDTFRAHPEMPLQLHHFTTWRLNWDAKTVGLISIAEQLGISPDSFLFVDDNPRECAELRQALPEVIALALPADTTRIPQFLEHVWAFDRPLVTEEDRQRSAYYQQTASFGDEISKAGSLEEFMASLQLRVSVAPLEPARLARAVQLTQRTNQFNTTTIRRTESELASLQAEGWRIWTVEASDRFGDYGVVGVMIVEPGPAVWRLDSMMLSCRALGRGVEHRMVAALAEQAGDADLVLEYRRTAKNQPARHFLETIADVAREERPDGFAIRARAKALVGLRWKPTTGPVGTASGASAERAAAAVTRTVDYACIANQLATVTDILEAMRGPEASNDAESDVERQLARLWAELLQVRVVRRTDNFFDLGGHSLVAVLLLMRIRETFGVELSIEDVYTAQRTLADLAARIEAAQLAAVNPEDYAALLAEIESLSEEEVRELLAREGSGQV